MHGGYWVLACDGALSRTEAGMGDDKGSFGSADDCLRKCALEFFIFTTDNCVTLRKSMVPLN